MSTETLVPIGSIESVVSVVGIIWFLVCLFILIAGGWKGWLTVLNLAFFGMLWVGFSRPDLCQGPIDDGNPGYYPYVWYRGQWQSEQELYLRDQSFDIDDLWESPWEDTARYAMHVEGLSPRIYHPDCLWWAPVIVCGIGLLCSPMWLITIICSAPTAHKLMSQ